MPVTVQPLSASPDEAVVAIEVVRLPDEGHRHHVATVLVRTLTVLELWVVGIHEDAVQAAGAVEVVALQSLAPGVVAAGADVVREALLHRDLQTVVVGVLIGTDDADVGVDRVGSRMPNCALSGRRLLTVALELA